MKNCLTEDEEFGARRMVFLVASRQMPYQKYEGEEQIL